MTHIDGSLLRLVFRYPILAIGISAIVIGLLYLLDLENLLQPLTSLLSPVLSKWGLSHDVFGVINLVGGTAWILAFGFVSFTDLRTAHLTGVYSSSISYGLESVTNVMNELGLSQVDSRRSRIAPIDPHTYDAQIAEGVKVLDERMSGAAPGEKRIRALLSGLPEYEFKNSLIYHIHPGAKLEKQFRFRRVWHGLGHKRQEQNIGMRPGTAGPQEQRHA